VITLSGTAGTMLSISSSSVDAAQILLANSSSGGKSWLIASVGSTNVESAVAGDILFYDSTDSTAIMALRYINGASFGIAMPENGCHTWSGGAIGATIDTTLSRVNPAVIGCGGPGGAGEVNGQFQAATFNAGTGFQIGSGAAAGTFLRGNGTNYVASPASGVGANPGVVAVYDSTTLAATVTAASLIAAGAVVTGMYRLSGFIRHLSTTTLTISALNINYESQNSVAITAGNLCMQAPTSATLLLTNATATNTSTSCYSIVPYCFYALTGTAITWGVTLSAAVACEVHLRLEYLG
jgi:hypothetical protein